MGFDPPTHQLWVKIVGLPLQAWTLPRITVVLQRFDHPIQILPFGHEAGHYRDIIVLVDTKHPSRIPQSYAYREGDYLTQVDILILTWRLWEPTFFPPPSPPSSPRDRPPTHPQLEDDSMISACRSPSSSSSDVPSELTIDLSSWSPRSYKTLHTGKFEWKKKQPSSAELVTKDKPQSHSTPSPPMETLTPLLSGLASPIGLISRLSRIFLTSGHTSATKNQPPTSQIEQTFLLLHASQLTVPSHIAINSLPFLRTATIDSQNMRRIRGNPQIDFTDYGYFLGSEQNLQTNRKHDISILLYKRGQQVNLIAAQLSKKHLLPSGSPTQPKKPTFNSPQTQSGLHHTQPMQTQLSCEAHGDTYGNQMDLDTHGK